MDSLECESIKLIICILCFGGLAADFIDKINLKVKLGYSVCYLTYRTTFCSSFIHYSSLMKRSK